MAITSLNFFVFLILTTALFYICPKKVRWISLLGFSVTFFLLCSWKVCFYFVAGTAVAYIGARLIQEKCATDKSKKNVLIVSIAIELALLFLLKYIKYHTKYSEWLWSYV